MDKPVVYSNGFSPSAKRVLAALALKGVDHDVVEVDITQKQRPDAFNAVSPFGKVPVLVHQGKNLIESAVICEYINEVWRTPAMLPEDPAGRAYARQWIAFFNRAVADRDGEFVHVARDVDRKVAVCRRIFPDLAILDREVATKAAYFLGDDLSLVDVVIAPFTRILGMWAELVGDEHFAGYGNLGAYFDRLGAHPVLEEVVYNVPDDAYHGFFSAVLKDGMTVP
ncbi:MAG: glutathione S-transferase family protein [Kiloniellales bacterium]